MSIAQHLVIRREQPDDAPAIGAVMDAAFGGLAEGRLVERLRAAGDLVLALVAIHEAAVVSYVAWPRLWVEMLQNSHPAVGLAPLGVTPPRQRQGVGSSLTRAGLAQLKADGDSLVFVLGDPAYYRRFGFSLEAARAYDSIYAGAHFMALKLAAAAPDDGRVRYPSAFDQMS